MATRRSSPKNTPAAAAQKPGVVELIRSRLADLSSKPGKRNDPWKLAVAVEGGSMRWVVAAGMMSRLEQHGILPDLVVGTSGGGVAAACYAAGQMRYGMKALCYLNRKGFERNGVSRKFIDLRRALRGQPVMDVDGMVEVVLGQRLPLLKWRGLSRGPVPTWLTACTRGGELVLLPMHGISKAAQKLALKNTARLPVVAHRFSDRTVLWDGSAVANIPVLPALAKGATHILVVRCGRSESKQGVPASLRPWQRLAYRVLEKITPDLHGLLMGYHRQHAEVAAWLAQAGPEVKVLALPQVTVSPVERDERRLFVQTVEAYHYAGEVLGLPEAALPDEWAAEAAVYL